MQPYIWAIEILGQSGHSVPVLFNEKGDLLDINVSSVGAVSLSDDQQPYLNACDDSGQWGYINHTGQWTIPPQYSEARIFGQEGYARVCQNKRWGMVNTQGKLVVPCEYPQLTTADQHLCLALTEQGTLLLIDLQSGEKQALPSAVSEQAKIHTIGGFGTYGLAPIVYREKSKTYTIYLNRQGEKAIDARQGRGHAFTPDGIAHFEDEASRQFGLINDKGEWTVKPSYSFMTDFSEQGLAVTYYKPSVCLNTQGEIIYDNRYHAFSPQDLNCGLIRTHNGFLKQPGGEMHIEFAPLDIEYAHPFFQHSGVTLICTKDARWGLLTPEGQTIFKDHWIEPLSNHDSSKNNYHELVGSLRFLPAFITHQNTIEYVFPDGSAIATLHFEHEHATFKNAAGQTLKTYPIEQMKKPGLFFNRDACCNLNYTNEQLQQLIDTLHAAPARDFCFIDYVFGGAREDDTADEYAIDEDLEPEDILHGAIKTLAVSYYSETDWSSYPFLSDQSDHAFNENYQQLQQQLVQILGEPEEDDVIFKGDSSQSSAWQMDDERWLVLLFFSQYGDGDFQHTLCLFICDTFDHG